jgi:ankyrin repeat protein
MTKVFETIDVLDRNGKPRKMHKEIKNPSESEKWFYFIENKHIDLLHQMIASGININQIDTQGQTIAHYCLLSKSHKLFNLCLKNKVNFNVVDIFEVNPSKIIFQKNYSLYFFKNIIQKLDFSHLAQEEDYKESIFFLINYDSNLPKLKFLFLKYPDIMEPLRTKLTMKALERESIETWKFLSGRGNLISRLTKKLTNKETSPVFIKI